MSKMSCQIGGWGEVERNRNSLVNPNTEDKAMVNSKALIGFLFISIKRNISFYTFIAFNILVGSREPGNEENGGRTWKLFLKFKI